MRKKTLANARTELVTSAAVIAGLGYTPEPANTDIIKKYGQYNPSNGDSLFYNSAVGWVGVQALSTNTTNAIVRRDGSGAFSAGIITASSFSGSGASLTNLNGTNISSGTVPVLRLGSSGTRSSATFLRGDNV